MPLPEAITKVTLNLSTTEKHDEALISKQTDVEYEEEYNDEDYGSEEYEVEEIDEETLLQMLEDEQDSLKMVSTLFRPLEHPLEVISMQDVDLLKNQGYFVRDDLFSHESIDATRRQVAEMMKQGKLMPAAEYRSDDDPFRDRRARDDYIAFLSTEKDFETTGPLCSLLKTTVAIEQDLSHCFMLHGKKEIQLAYYKGNGAGYQRHRDAFPTDDPEDIEQRRLTLIVYLNDKDWSAEHGGSLQISRRKQVIDEVIPVGGRVVVFLSGVMDHQVMPSYHDRIAMTTWMT